MAQVVSLRLATELDAAEVAAIYRPAVTETAISFELEPPDSPEMARRIRAAMLRTPWIVCELDGAVAGYAYASKYRDRPAYQWSVEVSAYVHQDCRRYGIGRALYTSLFAVLVLQGFRNAYAGITLPNDASVSLHTRCGFTPVGVYRNVGYKFGAWHDVVWLERELLPHTPEPAAPVPVGALEGSADLETALVSGVPHIRQPLV